MKSKLAVFALLIILANCVPLHAQDSLNVHWIGSLSTWERAYDIATDDRYVYVPTYLTGFRIVDISNPQNPYEIGSLRLTAVQHVAISGDLACVYRQSMGVYIIDITDRTCPTIISMTGDVIGVEDMEISGNHLFTANGYEMYAVDLTNPADPIVTDSLLVPCDRITVSGNYAYLDGYEEGIYVVDISDPTNLEITDTYPFNYTYDIAVSGTHAYVTYHNGLAVFDVSNPTNIIQVGMAQWYHSGYIQIAGNYAYVSNYEQTYLGTFNITSPTSPIFTGYCIASGTPSKLSVSGNNVIVTFFSGIEDLQLFSIASPSSPIAVSIYSCSGHFRGIDARDDYTYLAREGKGLWIMDVSDPANMDTTGIYDEWGTDARGVNVEGDYAYVANGQAGLLVLNISNPTNPGYMGTRDTPWIAENLESLDGRCYIATTDAGLSIVDVSNPSSPQGMGWYNTPGYTGNVDVEWPYAFVADHWNGLSIIDVRHPGPGSMVEIGHYDPPDFNASDVAVYNNYAFIAGGSDGLHVIDISDPSSPTLCTIITGRADAIDISSNFAFVAGFNFGLGVLDIASPMNPAGTGYYNLHYTGCDVKVQGSIAYVTGGFNNNYFFFDILDCSEAMAGGIRDVSVNLTPHQLPIVIPANGGDFIYDASFFNNELINSSFDAWISIQTPDNSTLNRHNTQQLLTPFDSLAWVNQVQQVPASAPSGTYTYRLRIGGYPNWIWSEDSFQFTKLPGTDQSGNPENWELTTAESKTQLVLRVPSEFSFSPPSPNPFNPSTNLTFTLPHPAKVSLEVFDVNGRRVCPQQAGTPVPPTDFLAGIHTIPFDGTGLPSGIYFARLTMSESGATPTTGVQKMVLMK